MRSFLTRSKSTQQTKQEKRNCRGLRAQIWRRRKCDVKHSHLRAIWPVECVCWIWTRVNFINCYYFFVSSRIDDLSSKNAIYWTGGTEYMVDWEFGSYFPIVIHIIINLSATMNVWREYVFPYFFSSSHDSRVVNVTMTFLWCISPWILYERKSNNERQKKIFEWFLWWYFNGLNYKFSEHSFWNEIKYCSVRCSSRSHVIFIDCFMIVMPVFVITQTVKLNNLKSAIQLARFFV